jgi:hypothetical protein
VSLSWRNELRIGLCPDRLILATYSGRLRRRLAATELVDVNGRDDGAPWQAAVDALPSALASVAAGKPRATVILSSHFMRYALLPADPALKTADEWLAFARLRMESVHGHAVADWDVRVAETTRGGARIVSAVDRALLEALDARVAGTGASLVSVQPYLMAAFNRIRMRIGHKPCWLVIDEPGRLTLALIRDRAWLAVRSRRVNGDWRQRIPEILARECAALTLEEPCTEVFVQTPEAFDEPMQEAYRLHDVTLPRGTPHRHQPLAMVLA